MKRCANCNEPLPLNQQDKDLCDDCLISRPTNADTSGVRWEPDRRKP